MNYLIMLGVIAIMFIALPTILSAFIHYASEPEGDISIVYSITGIIGMAIFLIVASLIVFNNPIEFSSKIDWGHFMTAAFWASFTSIWTARIAQSMEAIEFDFGYVLPGVILTILILCLGIPTWAYY